MVFRLWETVQFKYELVNAGERVVMLLDLSMRGAPGHRGALWEVCGVSTFRDGLIVHVKLCTTQSEALEAAGPRE
ncbi:MAG: hypothetical protein ACRDMH_06460 [Solirubrobacterales bacterium]